MGFFFKLLLLNLLKLMEEIKKLKTNKILGKYTGRSIKKSNPSFNRMTNEFAFRGKKKRKWKREKDNCFANCFPFTTKHYTICIGEEGNGSSLGSALFVTVRHHKKALYLVK